MNMYDTIAKILKEFANVSAGITGSYESLPRRVIRKKEKKKNANIRNSSRNKFLD